MGTPAAPALTLMVLLVLMVLAAAAVPRRGLHFGGIIAPSPVEAPAPEPEPAPAPPPETGDDDDDDDDDDGDTGEWDGTPLSPFVYANYTLSIAAESNADSNVPNIGTLVGFYKEAGSTHMDGIAWSDERTKVGGGCAFPPPPPPYSFARRARAPRRRLMRGPPPPRSRDRRHLDVPLRDQSRQLRADVLGGDVGARRLASGLGGLHGTSTRMRARAANPRSLAVGAARH